MAARKHSVPARKKKAAHAKGNGAVLGFEQKMW